MTKKRTDDFAPRRKYEKERVTTGSKHFSEQGTVKNFGQNEYNYQYVKDKSLKEV
jgi:hypothetical protein